MSDATIILNVEGMTCGGCVKTVAKVLEKTPGVANVEVDLESAKAVIAGDAPPQDLIDAVEAAGFEASLAKS